MHYHLPIEGHVSVWFEEPTGLRGLDGVKENWQVPAKLLLEVAKVRVCLDYLDLLMSDYLTHLLKPSVLFHHLQRKKSQEPSRTRMMPVNLHCLAGKS